MSGGDEVTRVGSEFGGDVTALVDRAMLQAAVAGEEPSQAVDTALSAYMDGFNPYALLTARRVEAQFESPSEKGHRLINEAIASVATDGFAGKRRFMELIIQARMAFFPENRFSSAMIQVLMSAYGIAIAGERRTQVAGTDQAEEFADYNIQIKNLLDACEYRSDRVRDVVDMLLRFNAAVVSGTNDLQDQALKLQGLVDRGLSAIEQFMTGFLPEAEQRGLYLQRHLIHAAKYRKIGDTFGEQRVLSWALPDITDDLTRGHVLARLAELEEDKNTQLESLAEAEGLFTRAVVAQTDGLGKARVLQMLAKVQESRMDIGIALGIEGTAEAKAQYVHNLIDAADLYYGHAKGLRAGRAEAVRAYREEARCLMWALNANRVKNEGDAVLSPEEMASILPSLAEAALMSQDVTVMRYARSIAEFEGDTNSFRVLVRGGFEFELRKAMREGWAGLNTETRRLDEISRWLNLLASVSAEGVNAGRGEGAAKEPSLHDFAATYYNVMMTMGAAPRVGFDSVWMERFKEALEQNIRDGHDELKPAATEMLTRHETLMKLSRDRGCQVELHMAYLLAPTANEAEERFKDIVSAVSGGRSPVRVARERRLMEEAGRYLRTVRERIEIGRRAAREGARPVGK